MNEMEKKTVLRIRDFLIDEYITSNHTCGEKCQSLILNTYKFFCTRQGNVEVRERKEAYDKARYAKKKAGKKKHTG